MSQHQCASLDCPDGLSCSDYECELRHLDEQEQQLRRTSTKTNHNNNGVKAIVTASKDMGRSASTWAFNAVRLLLLQAQVLCDSYWMRTLTASKIQQRMDNLQSGVVLIKTHEYHGDPSIFQQEIRPLLSNIVVSQRQGMPSDPFWLQQATHSLPYEQIVQENPTNDPTVGALAVLQRLADHLELSSLSLDDFRRVDYQLMTMPIPGNQATKFWSFHARRGGRSILTLIKPPPTKQPPTHHIFVTRHGARQDNGPDRDPKWLKKIGHGRPQDAPLSPHGHQAAQELAQELQKYYSPQGSFFVVSSPLIRCMETAQAVAKIWKVPIAVEPGIVEVGSRPSHMGNLQELQERGFPVDPTYEPVLSISDLPKNECGDGAAARRAGRVAQQVVERILPNSHQSIHVLLVGHGASCLGLVSAFGAPEDYVGYCSVTQFQKTNDSWDLVGQLGDVAHLSDQATALNSAW